MLFHVNDIEPQCIAYLMEVIPGSKLLQISEQVYGHCRAYVVTEHPANLNFSNYMFHHHHPLQTYHHQNRSDKPYRPRLVNTRPDHLHLSL